MTAMARPISAAADTGTLRAAFRLHPEGVTIVTTLDEYGNQWGLTATSVTSVSLDPPLLLVCVASRSGLLGPLTSGAGFNVHFLAADQAELATRFATPMYDKFVGFSYDFAPSGSARLAGTLACLECVPEATHPAGDHTIVVGRVLDLRLGDRTADALVFFGGAMATATVGPRR